MDTNSKTHVVALALSSGETTEDYQQFVQSVLDVATLLHGQPITIRQGMSDNCQAIRAAVKNIFPDIVWGNCWAHLQVGFVGFICSPNHALCQCIPIVLEYPPAPCLIPPACVAHCLIA